jgi:hypothetical protein
MSYFDIEYNKSLCQCFNLDEGRKHKKVITDLNLSLTNINNYDLINIDLNNKVHIVPRPHYIYDELCMD